MILLHSSICSSVMTSGGARRMMSPWVGLAIKPLSFSLIHTSQAVTPPSGLMTMAFSSPLPLTCKTHQGLISCR